MTSPDQNAFDLAPPLPGTWHDLSSHLTRLLQERLFDHGILSRDTEVQAMRAMALPFYPGNFLVDAQLPPQDGIAVLHSFIYGEMGVVPLNGRTPYIHTLNETGALSLVDAASQKAYLKFFCQFSRSDGGPFEIIETTDGIEGLRGIAETVHPCHFDERAELWSAVILYSNALFDTTFEVDSAGRVRMLQETVIAENVQRSPQLKWRGTARWRKLGDSA